MRRRGALGLAAILLLAGGCALNSLERALDPDSREFLSKVRYLITHDERVTFLHLPADERPAFIEDFWKKRDPTPDTPENEFKNEYFRRIDMANRLFTDGQAPGWLQDRGRMYILLGPPTERLTYPRGVTFYGLPMEFWYYGFFEIDFVDEKWTGDYRLDPSSAEQIGNIMRAQLEWKPRVDDEAPDRSTLECEFSAESRGGGRVVARIVIPYRTIWMKADLAGKQFQATINVAIDAVRLDAAKGEPAKAWEFKKDYPLSYAKEELDALLPKSYVIEAEAGLIPGSYSLSLTLANSVDRGAIHRKIKVVAAE